MILRAMYGKEQFGGPQANFTVRHVPTDPGLYGRRNDRGEAHIAVAARDNSSTSEVRARGGHVQVSAQEGKRSDARGAWTTSEFEVSTGAVFRIYGFRKTDHMARPVQAAALVQAREGAPYVSIRFQLSGYPHARYSYACVEGHLDVLTDEEREFMQIPLPSQIALARAYRPESVRHLEVSVISQGTPRPPLSELRVSVAPGETVVLPRVRTRRRRVIDI